MPKNKTHSGASKRFILYDDQYIRRKIAFRTGAAGWIGYLSIIKLPPRLTHIFCDPFLIVFTRPFHISKGKVAFAVGFLSRLYTRHLSAKIDDLL